MSNSYTEFSFYLNLPRDQSDYLADCISSYNALFEGMDCDGSFRALFEDVVEQHGALGAFAKREVDALFIVSEDRGNPEALIEILQHFLSKYPDAEPIGFACAFSADKPRPHAFGGAAYIVFADKVRSMTTDQWLYDFGKDAPILDIHLDGGLVQAVQTQSSLLHDFGVRVLDFDIEGSEQPQNIHNKKGEGIEVLISELVTSSADFPVDPSNPTLLLSNELDAFCDAHGYSRIDPDLLMTTLETMGSVPDEHFAWAEDFTARWLSHHREAQVDALLDAFGGHRGQHPIYLRSHWAAGVGRHLIDLPYWRWVAAVANVGQDGSFDDPRTGFFPSTPAVDFLFKHGFGPDISESGYERFYMPIVNSDEFVSIRYDGDSTIPSDRHSPRYLVGRFSFIGSREVTCHLPLPEAVQVAQKLVLFPSMSIEEEVTYENSKAVEQALASIPADKRTETVLYEYTHPFFSPCAQAIEWPGDASSLASHLIDMWVPSASADQRQMAFDATTVHRL